VVSFLARTDEDHLLISVVSLAELRRGVERMALGARRSALDVWLSTDLPQRFAGRILAIDEAVAESWGRLVARSEAAGRPVEAMDALLAATAERHRLTLVTRNVADFEPFGLPILNPWRT